MYFSLRPCCKVTFVYFSHCLSEGKNMWGKSDFSLFLHSKPHWLICLSHYSIIKRKDLEVLTILWNSHIQQAPPILYICKHVHTNTAVTSLANIHLVCILKLNPQLSDQNSYINWLKIFPFLSCVSLEPSFCCESAVGFIKHVPRWCVFQLFRSLHSVFYFIL